MGNNTDTSLNTINADGAALIARFRALRARLWAEFPDVAYDLAMYGARGWKLSGISGLADPTYHASVALFALSGGWERWQEARDLAADLAAY